MNQNAKRLLFWSPRLLCIAFAIFLSLFALDVFNEHLGFAGTLLALVMHMIWPASVVAVLALAWRWEWVGAVLFAALGVFYAATVRGHLDWKLVISGPLFLLAALFLVNWFLHADLHSRAGHSA
jgi:hypothetical protein